MDAASEGLRGAEFVAPVSEPVVQAAFHVVLEGF